MIGTVLGTIALVAVTIVIGRFIDRKLTTPLTAEPPPRPAHQAGEAPATAIRASALQLARLRTQRCPGCRAVMACEPDDRVAYAERELIVLQFRCPRCAAKRVLYAAAT